MTTPKPGIPREQQSKKGPPRPDSSKHDRKPTPSEDVADKGRHEGEAQEDAIEQNTRRQGARQSDT